MWGDWHGNTGCLVAQDLVLLTKVGALIHQEISNLTMLYFPFSRTLTLKGENEKGAKRRIQRANRREARKS
jgi:hypothetical protein